MLTEDNSIEQIIAGMLLAGIYPRLCEMLQAHTSALATRPDGLDEKELDRLQAETDEHVNAAIESAKHVAHLLVASYREPIGELDPKPNNRNS